MVGDIEIVNPDKAKMETDHIDTQMIKIGQTFMGMTLGCVRCHDHKFDPIGLEDYYGIAGMLRSSPSSHKMPDMGVWSSLNSTVLPETPAQLEARKKLEAENEQRIASLKSDQKKLTEEKATVVKQLAALGKPVTPAPQVAVATDNAERGNRSRIRHRSPRTDKDALTKRRDELDAQLKTLGDTIKHAEFFKDKTPRAFAMGDGPQPADMPVYVRGNPYAPGTVVPRGAVRVASWDKFPAIPAGQSGRLQLADWLADERNPLTARVTVNRIWQKLFGTGIVPSVDYFGTRGDVPTHPELLDHLATRFMQGGWSQKAFLRSLVLSRTYRLSSANEAAAMKLDPENKLYWRMNRQRLDAEALRDSLLAISGELTRDSGGPALVLENPENCGALSLKGVNPPNYRHRKPRPSQEFERTIYLPVSCATASPGRTACAASSTSSTPPRSPVSAIRPSSPRSRFSSSTTTSSANAPTSSPTSSSPPRPTNSPASKPSGSAFSTAPSPPPSATRPSPSSATWNRSSPPSKAAPPSTPSSGANSATACWPRTSSCFACKPFKTPTLQHFTTP